MQCCQIRYSYNGPCFNQVNKCVGTYKGKYMHKGRNTMRASFSKFHSHISVGISLKRQSVTCFPVLIKGIPLGAWFLPRYLRAGACQRIDTPESFVLHEIFDKNKRYCLLRIPKMFLQPYLFKTVSRKTTTKFLSKR